MAETKYFIRPGRITKKDRAIGPAGAKRPSRWRTTIAPCARYLRRPETPSGSSLLTRGTTTGLMSTAGDLVFGGTADGFFFALDAETGEPLWNKSLGGRVHAGPMGYAVSGRQYVAIAAGNAIFAFALPE